MSVLKTLPDESVDLVVTSPYEYLYQTHPRYSGMSELDLAYIAGLVDGEAYIGIKKTHRKDCVSPIYHERIQIRMINENAIHFIQEVLGGNYYQELSPYSKSGRPLYCYQATDKLACEILLKITPYLKVKKESAKIVLQLRDSKNDPQARRRGGPTRRVMDSTILETREYLYKRAKEVNHID